MSIEDLKYMWEGKTILFTHNGVTKETTIEHGLQLYTDNHYYTESSSYIVFDLDKYTAKEMLKFIFEKQVIEEDKSIVKYFIIGGIVSFIVIVIIGFYIFGGESEKQTLTTKPVEIQKLDTLNVNNQKDESEEKNIPIIDKNIEKEKNGESPIIPKVENVITEKNQLLIIDKLNYEIEELMFYNEKVMNENKLLKDDISELKNQNKNLLSENRNLQLENTNLKDINSNLEKTILGEKTNLEMYLGTKVFEACRKKQGDSSCEKLFNSFYNK